MRRALLGFALAAVLAFGFSGVASAIPYGDFNGSNVDWFDVMENSTTDPGALFGMPAVSGNALLFLQPSFSSASFDSGTDITAGTLTLTLKSKGGVPIQLVSLSETGSFLFDGGAGNDTQASISGLVTAIVTHRANGTALAVPVLLSDQIGVAGGGLFNGNTPSGNWLGTVLIDVAAQVPDAGTIIINLNNVLMTTSTADGGSAQIAKSAVRLEVNPSPVVPEPGSLGLLWFVFSGLVAARLARS